MADIFTITIIVCRHVTNVTSRYKISPIIFTITIIFCRHVRNVTNVTSRYKISPIIFTITITFCRHVTKVSNVTSRYKISPILGYRAPLSTIKQTLIFLEYSSTNSRKYLAPDIVGGFIGPCKSTFTRSKNPLACHVLLSVSNERMLFS